MQTPINIRFDKDTLSKLDKVSVNMTLSKSEIIKNAVDYYLNYIIPYLEEVQKGIDDAETGSLVSHDTVRERIKKAEYL